MEGNPGFKCCCMCKSFCFQNHGEYGRSETDALFTVPTFFRLIRSSYITGSELLRIPALILENPNLNIKEKLCLKGPSGFECEVTVQQDGYDYALDTSGTGFISFIKHHAIEDGDSLVFYLIAESSFLVKVYDKCGSEKKSVPVSKTPQRSDFKHRSRLKESRHDDTKDSDGERRDERGVDNMPNLRRKKLSKKVEVRPGEEAKKHPRSNQREPSFNQPAASLVQQGNRVDVSPVNKDSDAAGVGDMPFAIVVRQVQQENRVDVSPVNKDSDAAGVGDMPFAIVVRQVQQENRVDVSPVNKDSDAAGVGDMEQPVSSRELRSTPKRKSSDAYRSEQSEVKLHTPSEFERKEAAKRQINAANALIERLQKPSQLIVIGTSHIGQHRVYLSKLPLPEVSTYLTVKSSATGEHYNVRWFIPPDDGSRSRLSSGWRQIVDDHKLDVDDVCVFEATDRFVLEVHIFRLTDYYKRDHSELTASAGPQR